MLNVSRSSKEKKSASRSWPGLMVAAVGGAAGSSTSNATSCRVPASASTSKKNVPPAAGR
jgi:hypothetical protein